MWICGHTQRGWNSAYSACRHGDSFGPIMPSQAFPIAARRAGGSSKITLDLAGSPGGVILHLGDGRVLQRVVGARVA